MTPTTSSGLLLATAILAGILAAVLVSGLRLRAIARQIRSLADDLDGLESRIKRREGAAGREAARRNSDLLDQARSVLAEAPPSFPNSKGAILAAWRRQKAAEKPGGTD